MIKPNCLREGDEVRVIAPSRSLSVVSEDNRQIADRRLKEMDLRLSFGKHVMECGRFHSSSVKSRIEDLHEAFSDPNVKGILTVLGGFNSNQLLASIDYELIRENPKPFCGFSDATVLQNAFLARADLITYSGPHYSTFAMKKGLDYTYEGFKKALFSEGVLKLPPSLEWSSDAEWYLDQENRSFEKNPGPQAANEGEAEGRIIGGNLGSFILLKGTPYMPSMQDAILFLEDTESGGRDVEFDRNLQSLIDLPDFAGVRGIVIGRFEKSSNIDAETMNAIIHSKPALKNLPVVYNFDFGHTTPMFTFPVGGYARLKADKEQLHLEVGDEQM